MRTRISGVLAAVMLSACGSELSLPQGMSCDKTVNATGEAALISALANATRGTCIVAGPGTYRSALTVPDGVVLGAGTTTVAQFSSPNANEPAITVGKGAVLSGIEVLDAPGVGIYATGRVTLLGINIERAHGPGVVLWCEDDCLTGDGSALQGLRLAHNSIGLWVRGAKATISATQIYTSEGSSLSSGYGLVVSNGGAVTLSDSNIEDNQALGVLVDGAGDTSLAMTTVTVKNNLGRGVWAQGLSGTIGNPRLSLDACTLEGNRFVGLGARGSKGIRVTNGRIGTTVKGQTTTNQPGVLAEVGDGLGLFDTTGDVVVEGAELINNGRTQALIDQGATGIRFVSPVLTAAEGQRGLVVQTTTASVQAPNIEMPTAGQELPVSAPQLGLPTR